MSNTGKVEWKDSGFGIDLPDGRSLLGSVICEDDGLRKMIVKAVNAYLRAVDPTPAVTSKG